MLHVDSRLALQAKLYHFCCWANDDGKCVPTQAIGSLRWGKPTKNTFDPKMLKLFQDPEETPWPAPYQ